ncbi:hydrogenase 4 membrane subunit [Orbus sturtevantii]|uniref:hydrogenase 4 membrane subunit n=1 Tax=Orbus sturtevantii TaxID=3074109 RepID=UPI00370D220A
MTESFIVNNLAGILVVTSIVLILVKRLTTSILVFALQSLILVTIFFVIAYFMNAHELYSWAITSIITKVILVPTIVYVAFRNIKETNIRYKDVPIPLIILLAAAILLVCYFVAAPVKLPLRQDLKPVLAVSLALFFIGLMCIISQRNIVKQIFGYCLMENGSHLTLALLAFRVPELVEIGVTTDAVFAVIIMAYFARRIHRDLRTLDANKLNALKG